MSSMKFRVSTSIKNYVLTHRPYSDESVEYGFERYTDPEIIAEAFLAMHGEGKFSELLDKSLAGKPDQRAAAKEIFGA